MSLILLWQYRQGTPPVPPIPHDGQPPAIGEGGAGGWAVNQWKARTDKLRREIQLEEEELLAVAQIAVQQLARDHMQRQATR